MASLQIALSKAFAQLRELTRSQRIAIVLGGVLVGVSLVWLLQWAATPEMVPLLDQSLDPEDIALIQSGLDVLGEPYERNGATVLVRASADRSGILAKLQAQEQLPSDTSISFAALVKESNPWISATENDRRWSVALAHELERVLRQLSGVKTANVFLNLSTGRKGFSREQPRSTGSVTLIMRGSEPVSESLGKAAARLVAGAVSGLSPQRVEVIDGGNGRSVVDWDVEAGGATQLQRLKREHERRLAAKVKGQLADAKARVSVQVEIESATRSEQSTKFSDPVETQIERTSDDTARRRPTGQPGVQPNVGVALSGGGIEETSTKTTDNTTLQPSNTTTSQTMPPGEIKESFAAINISHDYLASIFKRQNPDDPDPNEDQIQAIFEKEKTKIVNQITALVKPQDAGQVRVDWYYDTIESDPAAQAGFFDDPMTLVNRYGPQSGLALLALISMGLMFRMARRPGETEAIGLEIGLPKDAIEAAQQAATDVKQASATTAARQEAESAASSIGHAAPTEGLLVAHEVDEKAVQLSKMLEQMKEIVAKDPTTISTLLEQWSEKDDR